MRAPLLVAFALLGAIPAWAADEPSGCDSVTSSGARGCEAIRKGVKFEIPPQPFVIQVSGVEADSISLAIVPASE